MQELFEKVAFLKGLMAGMDIDETKGEGKIYTAIVDALEEISYLLEDMSDRQDDLEDYVEEIDSDLGDVEDVLYEEEGEDLDDDFVEITCPECGEAIYFDLESEEPVVECPNCGQEINIDELLEDACCDCEGDLDSCCCDECQ